jgi:hypothetical protein
VIFSSSARETTWPGLPISCLTGAVVSEALIRAFAGGHQCEMPGDAECPQCLGTTVTGNSLHDLILAKAIAPEDSLRLGLTILAALADLARTDAESVLAADSAAGRS